MKEKLHSLLVSRRVWIAALGLLLVVGKVLFPAIPAEVVDAYRIFALALIAALTVDDAVQANHG